MRGSNFLIEVDKDIGGVTICSEDDSNGEYCNLQTPEELIEFASRLHAAGVKAFEKKELSKEAVEKGLNKLIEMWHNRVTLHRGYNMGYSSDYRKGMAYAYKDCVDELEKCISKGGEEKNDRSRENNGESCQGEGADNPERD